VERRGIVTEEIKGRVSLPSGNSKGDITGERKAKGAFKRRVPLLNVK